MKELIMQRIGCTEKEADSIVKDLSRISPELKPVLDCWCDTGEVDGQIGAEGYSLKRLMDEYDMKFTGALLTLDWLLKDPETAKKALCYGIR